jgi:cathepsin B
MKMGPKPTAEELAAIPASFDSAANWKNCARMITNIRDQSNCGCCWAFGAAEAASDRLCIASNATLSYPLSVEEMCFCSSMDGCDGGDTYTPWLYISMNGLSTGADQGNGTYDKSGFCSAFSLPHCHHHGPQGNDPYPDEGAPGCPSESSPACPTACDSSAQAPHNNFATDRYTFQGSVSMYSDVPSIQTAIMKDGPVEAAFTVYSDFENYVSGIYQYTSGDELGGHAIKIVGWGTQNGVDYWKIQNSWNPYWGESGYFRMIRGTDNCGIEDDITCSSPGATWSKK